LIQDSTLIPDLRRFLDVAKSKNILVVVVLWNAAVLRNQVK
jgi:mannan endo-1,4-beta-mannosidase